MANSVDPDQTAPIGAVCSGSTLFASILNLAVMLVDYLQQTTSADDIFRFIFSWPLMGYRKAVSSLFLSKMFAKLERIQRTVLPNIFYSE